MSRPIKLGLVWLAIVLFVASLAIMSNLSNRVSAQETAYNIETKLQELKEDLEKGDSLITFQFVTPISEGDNYWTFGDIEAENPLSIVEIGEDYFCFSESSRAAVVIRCVPFSNIASFNFIGS